MIDLKHHRVGALATQWAQRHKVELDAPDPAELAAALKEPGCPLKTLALHNTALEPAELAALADGLQVSHKLRALELAQTTLTGRAGLPLAAPPSVGPRAHATERHLDCYRKLESHDELSRSTRPRDVGGGGSQGQPSGLIALCRALRCDSKVALADLTGCAVGDGGLKLLADALRSTQSPPLREVRLGRNGIGDDGAAALASALRRSVVLAVLGLEENAIGAGGASALAGALEVSVSLGELDLSRNRAGARGVAALAAALPRAPALRVLRLAHNSAAHGGTHEARLALEAALRAPLRALRLLALEGNGFGVDARSALRATADAGPNRRLQLSLGGRVAPLQVAYARGAAGLPQSESQAAQSDGAASSLASSGALFGDASGEVEF